MGSVVVQALVVVGVPLGVVAAAEAAAEAEAEDAEEVANAVCESPVNAEHLFGLSHSNYLLERTCIYPAIYLFIPSKLMLCCHSHILRP